MSQRLVLFSQPTPNVFEQLKTALFPEYLSANILLISGGNTFTLLNHLKLSGLDESIKQFWQKDNIVLSGFSAGAIVLSPSIGTAKTGAADADELGITDLTGLNIIDFEVWPHYYDIDLPTLTKYQSSCPHQITTIGDEEVVVLNK